MKKTVTNHVTAAVVNIYTCQLMTLITVSSIIHWIFHNRKVATTTTTINVSTAIFNMKLILRGFGAKFLQAGCPSCRPTNSVKAKTTTITTTISFCLTGLFFGVNRGYAGSSRSSESR